MNAEETADHRDLDLVQRGIEGDEQAVRELYGSVTPFLISLLIRRGVPRDAAEELLAALWTDCLMGAGGHPPLLERYTGATPLRTWLAAIVFNRWISLRRREAAHARAWQRVGSEAAGGGQEFCPGEFLESDVLLTLGQAVRQAVDRCDPEALVLLQLVFLHGVSQRDLAGLAGCHESQLSRKLKAAEKQIAEWTRRAVLELDPLLELTWDDFLHLSEGLSVLDKTSA